MSEKKNPNLDPEWLSELAKEFGFESSEDQKSSEEASTQLLPNEPTVPLGEDTQEAFEFMNSSQEDNTGDPQKTVVVNQVFKNRNQQKSDNKTLQRSDLASEIKQFKDSVELSLPAKAIHLMEQAQNRIIELESEVLRLKEENEIIRMTYNSAKNRMDQLEKQVLELEQQRSEILRDAQQEINALKISLHESQKIRKNLQTELENLKNQIPSELRRIRQREQELESRLELLRLEKQALIRTKDEQILDLKKRLDDLTFDLNSLKEKNQALVMEIEKYKDLIKNVGKDLRLVLVQLGLDLEEVVENDTFEQTG